MFSDSVNFLIYTPKADIIFVYEGSVFKCFPNLQLPTEIKISYLDEYYDISDSEFDDLYNTEGLKRESEFPEWLTDAINRNMYDI